MRGSVAGRKSTSGIDQQARVEQLRSVVLDERAEPGVESVAAHVVMNRRPDFSPALDRPLEPGTPAPPSRRDRSATHDASAIKTARAGVGLVLGLEDERARTVPSPDGANRVRSRRDLPASVLRRPK